MAIEKEEKNALVSARPKFAFETFTADVSQYPTFLFNQEELYKMFYDPNAHDKGVSQQLFQLSKNFARTSPEPCSALAVPRIRLRKR